MPVIIHIPKSHSSQVIRDLLHKHEWKVPSPFVVVRRVPIILQLLDHRAAPSGAFVDVVGICCNTSSANNSLCDFLTIASRRPGRSFSYSISYLCSTGETTRNSRQSRPNNLLVTTFMLCFPFRVRLSISKKERNVKLVYPKPVVKRIPNIILLKTRTRLPWAMSLHLHNRNVQPPI